MIFKIRRARKVYAQQYPIILKQERIIEEIPKRPPELGEYFNPNRHKDVLCQHRHKGNMIGNLEVGYDPNTPPNPYVQYLMELSTIEKEPDIEKEPELELGEFNNLLPHRRNEVDNSLENNSETSSNLYGTRKLQVGYLDTKPNPYVQYLMELSNTDKKEKKLTRS